MLDITELDAVNIMLESVGETKVTSLSGTLPTDVSNAQSILSEVDGEFQMQGWSFNTRIDVTLTPDGSSPYRTYLPANAADDAVPLMVIPRNRSKKYGLRRETTGGGTDSYKRYYLYDINEDTDALGESIDVDLVIGIGFEEMPHAAKNYVARFAARMYAERLFGEANSQLRQDEMRAFAAFERYESYTIDYRMSDTDAISRATLRPSPLDGYSS